MGRHRLVLLAAALGAFGAGEAFAAGSAAAGQTFLWLAVILFLARLASGVERVGMPGVLGELLLGVLLGNLALLGLGFFDRIAEAGHRLAARDIVSDERDRSIRRSG